MIGVRYSNLHSSTNRKHFRAVCLRLKRGIYRWKRKCFTAHVTCYSAKPNSVIFHVLMCFRVRFSISKLTIL
jgi:hypothetical protein